MTFYDAWIAMPDEYPELLAMAEGYSAKTTLTQRSPSFPEGDLAFRALCGGIRSGRFRGLQVDPLVWAALMSKAEIVDFLGGVYGPPGQYEGRYEGTPLRHIAERMGSVRAFVAELPEDGLFALVADEF